MNPIPQPVVNGGGVDRIPAFVRRAAELRNKEGLGWDKMYMFEGHIDNLFEKILQSPTKAEQRETLVEIARGLSDNERVMLLDRFEQRDEETLRNLLDGPLQELADELSAYCATDNADLKTAYKSAEDRVEQLLGSAQVQGLNDELATIDDAGSELLCDLGLNVMLFNQIRLSKLANRIIARNMLNVRNFTKPLNDLEILNYAFKLKHLLDCGQSKEIIKQLSGYLHHWKPKASEGGESAVVYDNFTRVKDKLIDRLNENKLQHLNHVPSWPPTQNEPSAPTEDGGPHPSLAFAGSSLAKWPGELRMQLWKLLLPGPRLLVLLVDGVQEHFEKMTLKLDAKFKPSILFHICRETRDVALATYTLQLARPGITRNFNWSPLHTRLDPTRDAIYFQRQERYDFAEFVASRKWKEKTLEEVYNADKAKKAAKNLREEDGDCKDSEIDVNDQEIAIREHIGQVDLIHARILFQNLPRRQVRGLNEWWSLEAMHKIQNIMVEYDEFRSNNLDLQTLQRNFPCPQKMTIVTDRETIADVMETQPSTAEDGTPLSDLQIKERFAEKVRSETKDHIKSCARAINIAVDTIPMPNIEVVEFHELESRVDNWSDVSSSRGKRA